ncbi:hypothetical protein [Streptomyces decoyicus]
MGTGYNFYRPQVTPAGIGAYTVPVSTYGPNSIKAISAGTPTISVQRGT